LSRRGEERRGEERRGGRNHVVVPKELAAGTCIIDRRRRVEVMGGGGRNGEGFSDSVRSCAEI
jgi:hypothetical protein